MTEIIRIPNINNYIVEIIGGELILTPKDNYITATELSQTCFKHSRILECSIKDGEEVITDKTSYLTNLKNIYKTMPAQLILQTTQFNVKLTNENGEKGYQWCPLIQMSVQHKDANGTLQEILHMVRVNNYTVRLRIQLKSGRIIKINNTCI